MFSASFFTWIQSSNFYAHALRDCVAIVPLGTGRWIDVGCGPGLMSRQAARRGFQATGCDCSPAMVRAARRLAAREGVPADFQVASLEELDAPPAQVVSAASLLAVLPDPRQALYRLWSLVAPGGHLLLVENLPQMRPGRALGQAPGLLMWALARRGRSAAADIEAFRPEQLAAVRFQALLDGMLGCWLLERAPRLFV